MQELVTVIMGAYNSESFVGAALASIREQTHEEFHVFVVDAGSTDLTADMVRQCERDDERFTMLRSRDRLSCPQARNVTLPYVRSELVATLDSDDIMEPRRLERQMAFMGRHPTATALGGWLLNVDRNGLPMVSKGYRGPHTPAQIAYSLPFHCPWVASAIMFRTWALREVGGFPESYEHADDYPTVWRVSQLGPTWTLPAVVGQRRHHPGQISSRSRHAQDLQVALMRQQMAASVMGTAPDLASVILWGSGGLHATPSMVEAARNDLVRYHNAFLCKSPASGEDRAWIDHLFAKRMAALDRLTGLSA
jgi:glycosyltransferase involved in cell wall biosynthesis